MGKKLLEFVETNPFDERKPPEGGWHKPSCTFSGHHWALEIEQGQVSFHCLDPCDPDLYEWVPSCHNEFYAEDCFTPERIPVALKWVDDSTPSTPAGPAEYGFYIEVRAA